MKSFIRTIAISATLSAVIFCAFNNCASAEPVKAETDSIKALALLEVRSDAQPYRKMNAVFQQVRGTYLFDQDDRSITLYRSGRQFYAAISGQPTVEIIPTSANTFASVNGALELLFKEQRNGLINDIAIRLPKEKMQFALR